MHLEVFGYLIQGSLITALHMEVLLYTPITKYNTFVLEWVIIGVQTGT